MRLILDKIFLFFLKQCNVSFILEIRQAEAISETIVIVTISTDNPADGHPGLEIVSEVEELMFLILPGRGSLFNLTKEKLFAMRDLHEDSSVVKESADKVSCGIGRIT